jgi:hypothetical protein
MRNVLDKSCRKNQNILFLATFFFENRAVYEIMWKNIVETGRPQTTIWRKRIACRITKATHEITVSNTYCFATATIVAQTRLKVTLYVNSAVLNCGSVFPAGSWQYSDINRLPLVSRHHRQRQYKLNLTELKPSRYEYVLLEHLSDSDMSSCSASEGHSFVFSFTQSTQRPQTDMTTGGKSEFN